MKLIRKTLFWGLLGAATLWGLARLVDEGFAKHFALPVLAVFLGIGLIRGFGAMRQARRQQRDTQNALDQAEASGDQRTAWAKEVRKQAGEVCGICGKKEQQAAGKKLFSPEYRAQTRLEEIMQAIASASEVQGRLQAAAEQVGEEAAQ